MNHQNAQSSLKQLYEENIGLADGLKLTVKVLKKTLDKNKMSGENIEIFVLENKEGEVFQRFIEAKEIDNLLKIIEKEEAEEKSKTEKKQMEY